MFSFWSMAHLQEAQIYSQRQQGTLYSNVWKKYVQLACLWWCHCVYNYWNVLGFLNNVNILYIDKKLISNLYTDQLENYCFINQLIRHRVKSWQYEHMMRNLWWNKKRLTKISESSWFWKVPVVLGEKEYNEKCILSDQEHAFNKLVTLSFQKV